MLKPIIIVAAYIIFGGGALTFLAFCVASVAFGIRQIVRGVCDELRLAPRKRRGFDVLPPK